MIAPFICYNMAGPFPELLATNGCNCTVHSCPLHAHTNIQGCIPLSPCDKLLFVDKLIYSNVVDYVVVKEDDPTLAGEVKYFCSHYKKANKIAPEFQKWATFVRHLRLSNRQYIAALNTSVLPTPSNMSNNILVALFILPPISPTIKSRKIYSTIQNQAAEVWGPNGRDCDWCGKAGHHIKHCHSIGYCHYCSCHSHTGIGCIILLGLIPPPLGKGFSIHCSSSCLASLLPSLPLSLSPLLSLTIIWTPV